MQVLLRAPREQVGPGCKHCHQQVGGEEAAQVQGVPKGLQEGRPQVRSQAGRGLELLPGCKGGGSCCLPKHFTGSRVKELALGQPPPHSLAYMS